MRLALTTRDRIPWREGGEDGLVVDGDALECDGRMLE